MNRYFKRLTNRLDCYYESQGLESHEGYIEDRLIKYLCSYSNEFKELMKKRKLEKLEEKDFAYLISTLENKHQFSYVTIRDQLLEKMEMIEANQNRGEALYPDIDSLYAKLDMTIGEKSFLTYLLKCLKDTNYTSAKKYEELVEVLLNTKDDVLESINFLILPYTNFAYFTPEYLKLLLDYDCYPQLKNVVLCVLMDSDYKTIEKLNDLGKFEFSKALDFMIDQASFVSKFHIIEKLLEKGECKPFILDKINWLPEDLINYLGKTEFVDKKMEENQKKLLKDMCMMDREAQEYYQSILNTSKEQNSNLLELLVNDQFRKFSMEKRTFILQKIAYLDLKNIEKNQMRYRMKACFLVGNEESPGFLTTIDDSCFWSTFKFIQKERDIEVLDTKFLVLSRLRKQMGNKSLSPETYWRYLESLENAISNMDSKDQIKYLDSHSKFFEKHSLEKFAKNINRSKVKDELVDVLSENKKYKHAKYHYKLASFINQYDPIVAAKIIKKIENCQKVYNQKAIFHKVQEIPFLTIEKKTQQETLDQYSQGLSLVLDNQEQSNMEIYIPDYQYVNSILEKESLNQIVFKNKKNKLKIKLRKKEK